MSHEFRSPLYSIRALSKLLIDRVDGELTDEQAKQVRFIRTAAEELSETVDDLLDIAKIEAGKIEVRRAEFEVANLFSALRGMLRPLLPANDVELVFEPCDEIPPVYTDEGKVAQILRNFISNALKFTERGEVRVRAQYQAAHQCVVFSVSDTGIGIAPEHQHSVFEEFEQVESHLQNQVKGTGLGLPLCDKLCKLLGGSVGLESELGRGSTFTATIPVTVGANPTGDATVDVAAHASAPTSAPTSAAAPHEPADAANHNHNAGPL
jgi:signal transduction histidine kinase